MRKTVLSDTRPGCEKCAFLERKILESTPMSSHVHYKTIQNKGQRSESRLVVVIIIVVAGEQVAKDLRVASLTFPAAKVC